ncbi:MAG: ABC transporter ATP-binding protein [Coriobacteriia bacterium]
MTTDARQKTRTPAIILDEVRKVYGTGVAETSVVAVDGVSLRIDAGEFVVISGRSGSGKTTLLNLMAGMAAPTSGAVALDGQDLWSITDAGRARLRNERVGFVFQFPSLMPSLTALENVMLPVAFGSRRPDAGLAERATELLRTVGIEAKASAYPRQLSAGQQQRVVLARSLINSPRIILADEPTSNLDERTEAEMMELFRGIHHATGVTIVMVTHVSALRSSGTRSMEMADGRLQVDERVGAPGA